MRLNTYISYTKVIEENKQKDLIFYNNALNTIDLYCYDDNDLLKDITGATVTLTIQDKVILNSGEVPVLEKIVTSLTNPQSGNTIIEITKEDCENLEGNYIYELRISLAESGQEYILAQGNCCFKKSLNN
jgi:hypothetical protein